ncbi:YggS family pyridoxal phosphate-dependent enzyme [Marinospirillum minutulum]|uniref:YggS family pyridoxal phosphate-dependent enzyme n=1 Tax=Marinospirillum minutulum TaxID=64974 RepID=UPI00040DCDA3|nr:YggS family pyridoxal phosphate-dependent enzyme [Marinospirillum minutulum]
MLHSVITEHIAKVRQQVEQACHKFGRNPSEVKVLAVSKTQPAEAIRVAAATGQQAFGENYLQEALQKQQELADLPELEWHFIGAVQSNKTREIAENFAWLHTLARQKIAQRLNDQRPAKLPKLKVLIQVNISNEASKAGILPSEVLGFAKQLLELPRLEVCGLMCIPKVSEDFTQQRQAFAQLADLQAQLMQALPELNLTTLSMGMSGDLEAAIAEGSTLVRIGTAIFGAREPKV